MHTSSCLTAFCTCAFPPTRWQTLTEHKEHEDAVAQSQVQIESFHAISIFLQSAGRSEAELSSDAELFISDQNRVRVYFESDVEDFAGKSS